MYPYFIKGCISLFLAIAIIFATAKAHSKQPNWKLWQKTEHLNVSYRNIKNAHFTNNGKLLEIKASAQVNSSISGFLLFIQDVNNISSWLDNADKGELLQQISDSKNQFYIHFAGLWPIKPRLLVLRSHYWQKSDHSVEIRLNDDDSAIAKQIKAPFIDAIRINIHQAHWHVTPKLSASGQRTLLIEYQFIADAGGNVPQWLANHFALRSIWKSMHNITELLPKSQWQQHTIAGINELAF